MTLNYQNVWNSMNDIEQTITKLCNVREILDASNESLEKRNYLRAEGLNYAAYEYLEMIQAEFDIKFKTAWDATVKQINPSTVVTNWSVSVEADSVNDELYFNLPQNLCESLDLKEGDQLQWQQCHTPEGKWILKKVNNSYPV